MMKKITFLLFIFFSFAVLAENEPVKIEGIFEQGGIVYGQIEKGLDILIDDNKLPVSSEGFFVFGFDRDAPLKAKLEIKKNKKILETKTIDIKKRDWDIQRIDGLPQKQVSFDAKTLERIKNENAEIGRARQIVNNTAFFANGVVKPAYGRLSSPFGAQRILNGEARSPHSGIDIAAETGTPVYSSADGIITLVHEDMFLTGKTIMVDHGLMLSTIYVHLDSILVKEKQKVSKGEKIGTVGKTGRATGSHLHFGVSIGKTKIDPEIFLKNPQPEFLKK